MTAKQKFYLPPDVFFKEVLIAKTKGFITNELGAMFLLLSKKASTHRYWNRYTHLRDDIESEAVVACMKAFDGFKPYQKAHEAEVGEWDGVTIVDYDYKLHYNPHAWFTTAIMNQLKGFLKYEYKHKNIFNKMKQEMGENPDYGYLDAFGEDNREEFDGEIPEIFGVDTDDELDDNNQETKIVFQ